jgi:YidC/Oxa1 family membrane protein insertase
MLSILFALVFFLFIFVAFSYITKNTENLIPRAIFGLAVYYLVMMAFNYFFSVKEEIVKEGGLVKAESVDEYKNQILKDFDWDVEIKNIKSNNNKYIDICVEHGKFSFDEDSGSPISYVYSHEKNGDLVVFDFKDKINDFNVLPFSVVLEKKSPFNFSLKEKLEDSESIKLCFISKNKNLPVVEKTYFLNKKKTTIKCKISVNNLEEESIVRLLNPSFPPLNIDLPVMPFSYSDGGSLQKMESKDFEKTVIMKPRIVGIQDSYFAQIFLQNKINFKRAYSYFPSDEKKNEFILVLESKDKIKGSFEAEFEWYCGPKEYKTLKKENSVYTKIMEYGWFSYLVNGILYFLSFCTELTRNYGVSIILFSVLIGVLFFPFAYFSADAHKKREEFQKKMSYIKNLYKDDPVRRSAEQMELIKKYGVFPGFSGNIVSIIQIPLFFALRKALNSSIVLYKIPFFGWMTDITACDPLHVLPAFFAISLYLKISVSMDTPMKKIGIMIMSVVGYFIFSYISVGLLLFMITSFFISIVQTWLIGKN